MVLEGYKPRFHEKPISLVIDPFLKVPNQQQSLWPFRSYWTSVPCGNRRIQITTKASFLQSSLKLEVCNKDYLLHPVSQYSNFTLHLGLEIGWPAYVPIHPGSAKYFQFSVNGYHYEFLLFPFRTFLFLYSMDHQLSHLLLVSLHGYQWLPVTRSGRVQGSLEPPFFPGTTVVSSQIPGPPTMSALNWL